MESNENKIECDYGHHMADKSDFCESGLKNKYYKICRDCSNAKQKKHLEKHRKEKNEKRRDYIREYTAEYRKAKKEELANNIKTNALKV
jgi:hypothetical protein